MKTLNNESLYAENTLIVDVRTKEEFDAYHIHNAVNMPIFTNEERAHIGTVYKQDCATKAKKLGVKYISYKIEGLMTSLIEQSEKYDQVIIHCQRGGMRSGTIVSLLNAIGQDNVYQLENGIKGHRQYIQSFIDERLSEFTFVTLHGHTGVGKSQILQKLIPEGYVVMDYEEKAQHAGSVFGALMYPGDAPTQKQFEEELFYILKTSASKYIFMESESRRVGNMNIPTEYMAHMEDGIHILVSTNLEKRISNLIEDYQPSDKEEGLIQAISHLKKRIGNEKTEELIDYVKCGNLNPLVSYLLTDYYDPLYQYSIAKYEYNHEIVYNEMSEVLSLINSKF